MEEKFIISALKALAQIHRLQIFRELVSAGKVGRTPSQLSENQALAGATLSFHLKALTHADLIYPEREGRSLIYRANYSQVNLLLKYLTENCCEGSACEMAAITSCK